MINQLLIKTQHFLPGKSRFPADTKKNIELVMKTNLQTLKTPGQLECMKCIAALKLDADWRSVKYYIYNRITAIKRIAHN
jgi:hypothetical protein